MTKKEYAEQIAKLVGGKVTETTKTNGIVFTGIVIPNDLNNITPVIYIDGMYERNYSVEQAAEKVKEAYMENASIQVDISWLTDFEMVKPKLVARLYNAKTAAEVYISAEKYGFDDLIIIPYVTVNGSMSAKVTKALLDRWGMTENEVIYISIKNANHVILSMSELAPVQDIENFPMLVVTNEEKYLGAFSVIKAKEELAERFPGGYVVLPSSIHECIVVSLTDVDVDYCVKMVREVNRECVEPEDWLSDNIYIFNGGEE